MTVFPPTYPPVVHAEFRAAQKRTFFRFIPKFDAGKLYYSQELKEAVDKQDWPIITKFFEEYVSRVNRNDPNEIDAKDSFVNKNFYRPMQVIAGSFAERGQSPKQKLLLEKEQDFEKVMYDLEGCIKDHPGEGLFASPIKMPTGEARIKQAKDSWTKGREILNDYINILNNGLMLELNKVDTI